MNAATSTALTTNGKLGGDQGSPGALAVFDKIADPLVAIEKLGQWFFQSGLFGLTAPAQGSVVAMACLCDRVNPVEIARRYHIIEGRLSMKSEAMLAGFNERGGKHRLIERTTEAAEIELTPPGGEPVRFRFTWQEAGQEQFPWRKEIGGELKNNWKTPRGRMQMLWARVVSDGVRAVMPGVVVGTYTPEEIADFPATAAANGASSGGAAQSQETRAARQAELAEMDRQARTASSGDVIDVQPEPAATGSEAVPPAACSMAQLQRLAALGDESGLSRDELKDRLCEAAAVENPAQMTGAQAAELIRRLEEALEKKRSTSA